MNMATLAGDPPKGPASGETTTTTKVETPAGGEAPAGGEGAPEGGGEGEKNDFKVAKPDNVPDKFWDAEANKVKTDDVLKSYGELEKALTKAKEPPKAPEKYEYTVPEDIKKEFGLEAIPADDPYLVGFQNYAKEQGLNQEQHDAFVNWYIKYDMGEMRKSMLAEYGKLGDAKKASERIHTLSKWGDTALTPEEKSVMMNLTTTAAGVQLFEKFMKLNTSQRQLPDDPATPIEASLTQADIDDMMADDRYHDKKHPEYKSWNAKVEKAFARLYPDKKG